MRLLEITFTHSPNLKNRAEIHNILLKLLGLSSDEAYKLIAILTTKDFIYKNKTLYVKNEYKVKKVFTIHKNNQKSFINTISGVYPTLYDDWETSEIKSKFLKNGLMFHISNNWEIPPRPTNYNEVTNISPKRKRRKKEIISETNLEKEVGCLILEDFWEFLDEPEINTQTENKKFSFINNTNQKIMTKEKTNTSLTIATREQVVKEVVELNAVLEQELSNLKEITESPFITSGKFNYNEGNGNNFVDIFKCDKIRTLISILGFISQKNAYYQEGIKLLELTSVEPFRWCGYTFEEWKKDITIRVNIISYNDRKNELELVKNTISEYLPEENRMLNDLNRIKEILNRK